CAWAVAQCPEWEQRPIFLCRVGGQETCVGANVIGLTQAPRDSAWTSGQESCTDSEAWRPAQHGGHDSCKEAAVGGSLITRREQVFPLLAFQVLEQHRMQPLSKPTILDPP
ncbi:hypothetical protein H1C71_023060, partial [Ictidomys tridecemlineatus]